MDETSFQSWIGSIQGRDLSATKDGIIRATCTSRQTLANWQSGRAEPSLQNHIRIAYYAKSHNLPAYMPDKIKVIGLQKDIDGGIWIDAMWTIAEDIVEERFALFLDKQ